MANITNAAVAVAVINEAKTHKVFNGNMPETDADKIAQANNLLTLAEQAKQAGVQAEAVHAVLAAAQQEAGATEVPANPFGAAPAAAPAPTPAPEPTPAPAPLPTPEPVAPQGVTIDTAIPGYDDLGVPDILEAMDKLNPAGVEFVKAYEKENGERARIMNYQSASAPAPTVETPAPAPSSNPATAPAGGVTFANVEPSQYEQVEPWQGYDTTKIKDIMSVIEAKFTEDAQAARPVLAHVWGYESANKERATLLKKLKELAENGIQVSPPTPAAADPVPASAPAPVATEAQTDVVAESPFAQSAPAPTPVAENAFAQAAQPTPDAFPQVDAQPVQGGATEKAQAVVAQEGLPVPGPVQSPPTLPEDFTILSDVDVRKFQSQFNACQARAHYLASISEGHSNDARLVADAKAGEWIGAQSWPAKITVTEQQNQANRQPEVAQLRHTQHEYSEQTRQLKALRDIYQSTCERLSREQTGRASEQSTVR